MESASGSSFSFPVSSSAEEDSLWTLQSRMIPDVVKERNKETNRNKRRISRERTKSRIKHLESLVYELRKDQQQSQSLKTQLLQMQEERDRLAEALEDAKKASDKATRTTSLIQPSNSAEATTSS